MKVIWQLLQREASWIILQFWEETSERLFRSCRSCTDCLPFSISSDHQRSKTLWSFKRRHVDNSDDDSNDAQLQFVSSSYYNVLCAVFHVQSAQYIFGTFWHFLVIFSFFCWLFLFGCLWSMTSSHTRKRRGMRTKTNKTTKYEKTRKCERQGQKRGWWRGARKPPTASQAFITHCEMQPASQ